MEQTASKGARVGAFLLKYLIISFGCVLYAVGISLFLDAGGLASGGVTGIAIIISKATGWIDGVGPLIAIINLPLLILGWIFFGKEFFFSTLYVIGLSSLLVWIMDFFWGEQLRQFASGNDLLLNATLGGGMFGAGMGVIFRMGSSSGGTDIPVKILRRKFRHLKTGWISMVTDIIIVLCSYFVIPDFRVLFYTAVSVVVFTVMFDLVLYGGNSAKMVYIICQPDKADELSDRVLRELNTGATFIQAEGAYSKEQKSILLCVVKPFMYPKLRDLVKDVDKHAFMIVSPAQEIYGEGYKSPNDPEL